MKGWGQGGSSERSHDTLVLISHPSPRLTIFGLEIGPQQEALARLTAAGRVDTNIVQFDIGAEPDAVLAGAAEMGVRFGHIHGSVVRAVTHLDVSDVDVANAESNPALHWNGDDLVVHAVYVNEGPTLKRWRARARGRIGRIHKRTCHITVQVAQKETAN